MTNIEERLTEAAHDLRRSIERGVDVDAALARAMDSPDIRLHPDDRSRRPWVPLLVAAAVLVVVALVGVAMAWDDKQSVVSDADDPNPTTLPVVDSEVSYRLLRVVDGSGERGGSIAYLGIADALQDQWTVATSDPVPEVDLDQSFVLMLTLNHYAGCPFRLAELGLEGDRLNVGLSLDQPERDECGPDIVARTFFTLLERADLPAMFTVVLPGALDGSSSELNVDLAMNAKFHTPPTFDGEGPVVGGADLQSPAPGREITFDRMGDVVLGEVLDPSEVLPYEVSGSCGFWGPIEPSHDGDEPPRGLVSGADGPSPQVRTIQVGRGSTYRTASGVGVGTTLVTLERIYGDDLVVDRTDQNLTPTDGLVGWYQDVAAVRYGDNALTFYLSGDVVSTVKLSPADFWGDDEGCA